MLAKLNATFSSTNALNDCCLHFTKNNMFVDLVWNLEIWLG